MWRRLAYPAPASSTASRVPGFIAASAARDRSVVVDALVLGQLEHDRPFDFRDRGVHVGLGHERRPTRSRSGTARAGGCRRSRIACEKRRGFELAAQSDATGLENATSGGVPSENRVSASKPTIPRSVRSTMGWKCTVELAIRDDPLHRVVTRPVDAAADRRLERTRDDRREVDGRGEESTPPAAGCHSPRAPGRSWPSEDAESWSWLQSGANAPAELGESGAPSSSSSLHGPASARSRQDGGAPGVEEVAGRPAVEPGACASTSASVVDEADDRHTGDVAGAGEDRAHGVGRLLRGQTRRHTGRGVGELGAGPPLAIHRVEPGVATTQVGADAGEELVGVHRLRARKSSAPAAKPATRSSIAPLPVTRITGSVAVRESARSARPPRGR